MKIGFIGTGIMGRPMAAHLQAGGHQLHLLERKSAPPAELMAGGAQLWGTAAEIARATELIITMVPNTADVEEVLFGAGGVASGLVAGPTIIDMSSIDPMATQGFAAKIKALGCSFADAPVSGGELGAKNASLTIMVGASEAVFERIKPVLELLGKNITRIGEPGTGQIAKVANQIIVALNIEAVGEALVFAAKAGADPAKVRAALMGGFAASRVLEIHGERMIERSFNPGFRIRLHQKDLDLALTSAKALGLALPNTASTQQLFSACVAQGGADWDHSAMVRALEALAGHELS